MNRPAQWTGRFGGCGLGSCPEPWAVKDRQQSSRVSRDQIGASQLLPGALPARHIRFFDLRFAIQPAAINIQLPYKR